MRRCLMICMYFLIAFSLVGCDSNVETSSSPSSSSSGNVNENTKKVYGINEDVYINNGSGEYRLKITSVKETAERNEFSDVVANRVIIISYEYENISLNSDLSIDDWNFKVYDKDNNSMETYPVDINYGNTVGQGRKAVSSVTYALNSDINYVELEYYDNMFNSSSDCIFKLEW